MPEPVPVSTALAGPPRRPDDAVPADAVPTDASVPAFRKPIGDAP